MKGAGFGPYFDPDFDSVIERINPRVCVDNETCESCTLIKVDSANRHGILLEMVELLTDLDLVISKSYIASDGGWLMDVFHVTDHLGNKLTDPTLIRYIQQSLASGTSGGGGGGNSRSCGRATSEHRATEEVRTCLGKLVGPAHLASEYTAVEIMAADRPGLVSKVAAAVAELDCQVVSAQGWTHNSYAAIILYLTDHSSGKPITDCSRLARIQEQLDDVLEARHSIGQKKRISVSGPSLGRVHTERRLHQLMLEDKDYEAGLAPYNQELFADVKTESRMSSTRSSSSSSSPAPKIKTLVSIDSWKEKGYSVVNIRSRDRPKLLFDTVCTLTDMQYAVFHATVGAQGPLALQEYYLRHKDGCTLDLQSERQKVIRCLGAAVERRASHGLRLDVGTKNRLGLLSDITSVLRENGLTLSRMEIATRGERAIGTFYVKDASSGGEVDPRRVETLRNEIGGEVTMKVVDDSLEWSPAGKLGGTGRGTGAAAPVEGRSRPEQNRPWFSLGSLLWSHIERFSSNFGSIRS